MWADSHNRNMGRFHPLKNLELEKISITRRVQILRLPQTYDRTGARQGFVNETILRSEWMKRNLFGNLVQLDFDYIRSEIKSNSTEALGEFRNR
jgi:hypothetical protein